MKKLILSLVLLLVGLASAYAQDPTTAVKQKMAIMQGLIDRIFDNSNTIVEKQYYKTLLMAKFSDGGRHAKVHTEDKRVSTLSSYLDRLLRIPSTIIPQVKAVDYWLIPISTIKPTDDGKYIGKGQIKCQYINSECDGYQDYIIELASFSLDEYNKNIHGEYVILPFGIHITH